VSDKAECERVLHVAVCVCLIDTVYSSLVACDNWSCRR